MKIAKSSPDQLVIVDFPWFLGGFCLLGSGGFLFHLVTALQQKVYSSKDLWISITGLSLLACCGLFWAKRIVFSFDLRQRQLTWSRTALLARKRRTLSFSQISAVNLESSKNNDGNTLLYRVTLTTNEGRLPLTHAYTNGEKPHRVVRNAIAQALGLPINPTVLDTDLLDPDSESAEDAQIRAMVARGEIIQAVKEVRSQRNCSLAEARNIVAKMQEQS